MAVGESGSGSGVAADVWSNSASGENMIKGETETETETEPEAEPEADSVADDEPAAPAEKKESTIEAMESGSGQPSDEFGSGVNLAEGKIAGYFIGQGRLRVMVMMMFIKMMIMRMMMS